MNARVRSLALCAFLVPVFVTALTGCDGFIIAGGVCDGGEGDCENEECLRASEDALGAVELARLVEDPCVHVEFDAPLRGLDEQVRVDVDVDGTAMLGTDAVTIMDRSATGVTICMRDSEQAAAIASGASMLIYYAWTEDDAAGAER